MAWNKPIPFIDETLKPFWQGLKEHRFLLFRCNECGAWYWPAAYCKNHRNKPFMGSLSWQEASGHGRVMTFNITKVVLRPAFKDSVPYVYALVKLNEGPIISSNIIGCDPSSVYIDMPVRVVYEDVPDIGLTIPYFEPEKLSQMKLN
jgi:uncharacterized OB-fold protein